MTELNGTELDEPPAQQHHRRRKALIDVAHALVPDRLPPHSVEAEQGVLGCILLDPKPALAEARRLLPAGSHAFYDLKHQVIFDALLMLDSRREPIDIITLQQHLKDNKQLEAVGGIAYLMSLSDAVPSAANLSYYADIVRDKFALREVIRAASDLVAEAYERESGADGAFWEMQSRMVKAFRHGDIAHTSDEVWSCNELVEYQVDADPNTVVGVDVNGAFTRYLCRGYGAWIIGPSGVGKSSLLMEQAVLFTLGKDFCGMRPVRPLRVLFVQAENDIGDAAEQLQGILMSHGIHEMDDAFEDLQQGLKVVTERRKVGPAFVSWLERQIVLHRADVVFCDPFLSFAGIDVSRQDECSRFLRTCLNPVLADTGAVLIASHHTGKPKAAKDTAGWTLFDHAYAGLGSSELVNWARAVSIIIPLAEPGRFELRLAKRGKRAGTVHPGGDATTSIFLKHAERGIAWTQISPPEPSPEPEKPSKRRPAPKTEADLMAHVPVSGAITKAELIDIAVTSGIGRDKTKTLLDKMLDSGSVHLWSKKRPGTNPLKLISRHPQPPPELPLGQP